MIRTCIAYVLFQILNGELKRQCENLKQQLEMRVENPCRKSFFWLSDNHFLISMVDKALLTHADLVHMNLVGDNLVVFKNECDSALDQMDPHPTDVFCLGNLFSKPLERSERFKPQFTFYLNNILLNKTF